MRRNFVMRRLTSSAVVCLVGGASGLAPAVLAGEPETPAASAPEKAPALIKVGDALPADLSLLDAEGAKVPLSTLHASGPVVVIVYRGGWCPFCTRQMQDWNNRLAEAKALGATVVAVSVEKPEVVRKTIDKERVGYSLLIDDEAKVSRALGLGVLTFDEAGKAKYKGYGIDLDKVNSTGKWELPYPATLVVDRGGVVRFVEQNEDFRKRPDIDKVMQTLKNLKK